MTERIWIKHDGGTAYLMDKDWSVIVRLRSGETMSGRVGDFLWEIDGSKNDIVEWFPVNGPKPHPVSIMALHDQMADQQPTGVERQVCDLIAARQRAGVAKYGTTVADNPLSLREWLQHALEETLDKAIYLKRAINEIDAKQDDYK